MYGNAKPDLTEWCKRREFPLHEYPWNPLFEKAGLVRDAAYLLRPDTYVGLAEADANFTEMETYLKQKSSYKLTS